MIKLTRKIIIFVLGMSVLLAGIAMIVLPGPAIVVIPAGLAILGIEFAWARHWLNKLREKVKNVKNGMKGKTAGMK